MAALLPKTQEGIWLFIEDQGTSPGRLGGWSAFIARLRESEDNPRWFPSGKWATLQRMESLLHMDHAGSCMKWDDSCNPCDCGALPEAPQ